MIYLLYKLYIFQYYFHESLIIFFLNIFVWFTLIILSWYQSKNKHKTSNTSKTFILVLLCKNYKTTTLHSELLHLRLEEKKIHSIIVLLSLQNRKIRKLIFYSFVSQFEAKKIHLQIKHSFINFRITISSWKIQIFWRQSTGSRFILPWRLDSKQSSHRRMDKTNNQTNNQIIYLNSRNRKRVMGHLSSFLNINNHRCFTRLWVIFTTIFWRLSSLIRVTTYDLEGGY